MRDATLRGILQCMRRSSKRLPDDVNQKAAAIVAMSVEETPLSIKEYLSKIGKKGDSRGARPELLRCPLIAEKPLLVRLPRNDGRIRKNT